MYLNMCFFFVISTVTLEDAKEYCRILLHVEDNGSLCPTEARKSSRGWIEAKASLHSQLHKAKSSIDYEQHQE